MVKKTKRLIWLLILSIWLAAVTGGVLANFKEWKEIILNRVFREPMRTIAAPEPLDIREVVVRKEQEREGGIHSRLLMHCFSQQGRTAGVSPNVLRVRWNHEVEILGAAVSVDVDHNIILAEFVASINTNLGYEGNSEALFHMTFSRMPNELDRDKDQTVWFGPSSPFVLTPNDFLSIGAWIGNVHTAPLCVYAELIVYYAYPE